MVSSLGLEAEVVIFGGSVVGFGVSGGSGAFSEVISGGGGGEEDNGLFSKPIILEAASEFGVGGGGGEGDTGMPSKVIIFDAASEFGGGIGVGFAKEQYISWGRQAMWKHAFTSRSAYKAMKPTNVRQRRRTWIEEVLTSIGVRCRGSIVRDRRRSWILTSWSRHRNPESEDNTSATTPGAIGNVD